MVRELDSALSNAMDEISANELDDDKNLGDAMKYLLLKDQILLLRDRSYGIHKKMSGRSALRGHPLPDPGFPVLHEAEGSQI